MRAALTYANIVATLALFLALTSGAVYAASQLGKNAVKSKNISANAVKNRNLARNAVKARNIVANSVTTAKLADGAVIGSKVATAALTRANLAAGTLSGLQLVDATAASVPGLDNESEAVIPVPLSGTTAFTPASGKSYELLAEISGDPVDADGFGSKSCSPEVSIRANGIPIASVGMLADAGANFAHEPIGSTAVAIGLQQAEVRDDISAQTEGSSGRGPETAASLRIVVIEFW